MAILQAMMVANGFLILNKKVIGFIAIMLTTDILEYNVLNRRF